MDTIELKSGNKIPKLGLGTWRLKGNECRESVKTALDIGYRHIDTADAYENHLDVAEALKESSVKREKIFITSKVWRDRLSYDDLKKDAQRFLDELETDYLDLLLIHWPNKNIPIKESLKALKELKDEGRVRDVGVSNFTVNHLKDAFNYYPDLISVNQVEFHPTLFQKELLEFCRKNNIELTAYSPLGRGKVFELDILDKLADKYKKSPVQLALKWLHNKNIIAIPKASSKQHLKENFELADFDLSKEDEKKIDAVNSNNRIIDPGFGEFDY